MEFKSTFATSERRTFTVPLIDVPTLRALLRGVPGVYEKHVLPKGLSLVPKKLLELVKRPVVELEVELLTSSLLDSDLAQIFESKHRKIRVHDLLRYAMVHVSHKPSFLAGETLELAFCRLGAFRLQLSAKVSILSSSIFDLLRVVKRVIGADCNVHDTSIDTKHFELGYRFKIVMFKGHMQIERVGSSIIGYRGRFDLPSKVVSIGWRHEERCFDPSFGRCYSSDTVDQVDCGDSLIVPHSCKRLAFWKRFAFDSFQSFASTISCSLDERRRKIRALTNKLVCGVMVIDLIPRLVIKSPSGGFVERLGICSHRIEESHPILIYQPKLESNRPKHIHIVGGYVIYTFRRCKHALLPTLKGGVSALLRR